MVFIAEGNRDLSGEKIGIVINDADDGARSSVDISCQRAALAIGNILIDVLQSSGGKPSYEAWIHYHEEECAENRNPKMKKLAAVVQAASEGADKVEKLLNEGQTVISLGGNHVRGFDVIGAVRYCHERGIELGLLWVDAHPDLNTPETTPSGNIHGMVSAVLTGRGPKELLDLLRGAPFLKPENIMYIGLNDVDHQEGVPSTERNYLEELKTLGVKAFEIDDVKNEDDPNKMPQKILDAVTEFGDRLQSKGGKLWVELDVDVFSKEDMPAAIMDNENGMRATQGYHLFEHIGKTMQPLGMGVSELSPDKDPDRVGSAIAARCLGHAMGINRVWWYEN